MPDQEEVRDPILVALGQRLIDARLDYGRHLRPIRTVNQTDVGRALGVTGVTVGNWEAGKNDPGVPMLWRLAEVYGVRRAWLLAADGDMRSPGVTVQPLPTIAPNPGSTPVPLEMFVSAPEPERRTAKRDRRR